MLHHIIRLLVIGLALFFLVTPDMASAVIYEWTFDPDYHIIPSTTPCPGGADVSAVPNANLSNRNLTLGYLRGADLTNANLDSANLSNAVLNSANLRNANLTNANLTGVNLEFSNLANAIFTNAILIGASFSDADLTNANLTNTDLTTTYLYNTILTNANLTNTNLSGLDFLPDRVIGLTDANLTGANITGAKFQNNITLQQLCSTSSYKNKDLSGTTFRHMQFSGGNFEGQNLIGADLFDTAFVGANLMNAKLDPSPLNVNFSKIDSRGATGFSGRINNDDLGSYNLLNGIKPDGTIAYMQQMIVRNYEPLEGHMPIAIHVTQGMQFVNGGMLEFVFDDKPWNSTISFESGIPVTLNGELKLELDAATDPNLLIGNIFHLFDWSGVNPVGQFQIISGENWDTSHLYFDGTVTLIGIPEPSTLILLSMAAISLIAYGWRRRI